MKNALSKYALLVCLLFAIPTGFALTLQEAKNDGLIGELQSGYVGLVVENAPIDVVTLVREVNNQRRELYRQIAQQNGISVEQVAALAFTKAVEATPSGQYLQDANGSWVRK